MALGFPVIKPIKALRGFNLPPSLPEPRALLVVYRAFLGMWQGDATHLAAGVAYYAIVSMVPLFLGFVALVGMSLNSTGVQQAFLDFATENIPGSAQFIGDNIGGLVLLSNALLNNTLGILALFILLWFGRAVLAAVNRAVNRAWGVRQDRPFYVAIPQQFMMALVLGLLLLLSTFATSVIQVINNQALSLFGREPFLETGLTYFSLHLIPASITALIFLLIYRYLPNRPMRWAYVWPGVATATGLFECAKVLFLWYLEQWAVYDQLYGPLASAMVFLLWCYLSALILILGAKVSYEFKQLYYPTDDDFFEIDPQNPA